MVVVVVVRRGRGRGRGRRRRGGVGVVVPHGPLFDTDPVDGDLAALGVDPEHGAADHSLGALVAIRSQRGEAHLVRCCRLLDLLARRDDADRVVLRGVGQPVALRSESPGTAAYPGGFQCSDLARRVGRDLVDRGLQRRVRGTICGGVLGLERGDARGAERHVQQCDHRHAGHADPDRQRRHEGEPALAARCDAGSEHPHDFTSTDPDHGPQVPSAPWARTHASYLVDCLRSPPIRRVVPVARSHAHSSQRWHPRYTS